VAMPVTKEVAAMLSTIPMHAGNSTVPFLTWLHDMKRGCGLYTEMAARREFTLCKKAAGIERKLTFHDLRRTTAHRVYELTGDLRIVQALLSHTYLSSTFRYLGHHLQPLDRDLLEIAKQNPEPEAEPTPTKGGKP